MKLFRRLAAGTAFLVAVVVLVASLAAVVGVWIVQGIVADRAARVFGRIGAALDAADQGIDHITASLDRAAERLRDARDEQRRIAQEPQKSGARERLLARKVQESIAPEFGDAHANLQKIAEAAVVVNSILEDVGNFPLLSSSGLDLGRLAEINGRLAEVGPVAWEWSRLLGAPESEQDPSAEDAQLSRIEQALQAAQEWLAGFKAQAARVRQRAAEIRTRTPFWITSAALGASAACLWIALSQVSVLAHARSWSRRSGQTDPRPG
jgi:hypothetical protein